MNSYRVGIVGCGGVANAHAGGYLSLGLRIVACADVRREQLSNFSRSYGVKNLYEDYEQMLSKEELDIVSICTWPTLHSEMTVKAAEAGVNGIICEKPMATCLREADRMVEACDKYGAKLAIGHMRRFSDIYMEASRLISSNMVGEVTFMHGISFGDLLCDGIHLVDTARFLTGDQPVRWVMGQIDAREKRRRYGHYVEDASVCLLEFENGLRAFIELSQMTGEQPLPGTVGFTEESLFKDLERVRAINWWKRGGKYCTVRVQGTEGLIDVGELDEPQLRFKGKGDVDWQVPLIGQKRDPFKRQIEALIESMEQDEEPQCSGRSGRQTLEVVMAIFESSRRREIILLPLDTQDNPLATMIEKGEI